MSLSKIFIVFLAVVMAAGVASGCAVQTPEPVSELFTPTPSLTVTPTVIWFPATATPTQVILPTATANPAAHPSYGSLLFQDLFTSTGDWLNAQDTNGLTIVKDGSLTLAVKAAGGSLFAYRQNTNLSNFYLETTVSVNLCKGDDQIGVLFRVKGSQSFYRVLISCNGLYAIQQVVGATPAMLADWSPSSELQPGLWQPFKIGIWAYGNVLRLYLNDQMQAEVNRDTFPDGSIGFYAHAAADTPLNVGFSDLSVYQVNVGNIVPTAGTPTPSPALN